MTPERHTVHATRDDVPPRGRRTGERFPHARLLLALLLVALVALLAACQSDAAAPEAQEVQLAPASQLSAQVRSAPPVVQEAYRFAIANPDVLSKLPCYCGCGNMGHMSNLDCFVQEVKGDGSIVFESHALG
jgi:hypothetical protein